MYVRDSGDLNNFIVEVRGVLISANVLINCFLCAQHGQGWYIQSVKNLIRKILRLNLKLYLTDLDKFIVVIYCQKLERRIRHQDYKLICNLLSYVQTCPINTSVIGCAYFLDSVHPPDALRLAAAFEHDLVLVTWEPKHFAGSPQEVNELDVQQYTKRRIGHPESVDVEEDIYQGDLTEAGVWIFSVSSFSNTLDSLLEVNNTGLTTTSKPLFEFRDYELHSSSSFSSCRVTLALADREINGRGTDTGLIESLLRAIANTVSQYVFEMPYYELIFTVSDEWDIRKKVQVCCRIGDRFYRNSQTNSNIGIAAGHAYVSVLNAIIESFDLSVDIS